MSIADLRAPHVDLVSRKLRLALKALEVIAACPAGAANGESTDSMVRRSLAQAAIQQIGELR